MTWGLSATGQSITLLSFWGREKNESFSGKPHIFLPAFSKILKAWQMFWNSENLREKILKIYGCALEENCCILYLRILGNPNYLLFIKEWNFFMYTFWKTSKSCFLLLFSILYSIICFQLGFSETFYCFFMPMILMKM